MWLSLAAALFQAKGRLQAYDRPKEYLLLAR